MKTFYDDQQFVRRINKYRECQLKKRALESHWSVVEKVTIKIKKIGISNIEKRSKKRREDIKRRPTMVGSREVSLVSASWVPMT